MLDDSRASNGRVVVLGAKIETPTQPGAIWFLLAWLLCLMCAPAAQPSDAEAARLRARLQALPTTEKVKLTNDQWRKILTPAQFYVLREAATEPPFKNEYWNSHEKGIYLRAACGNELFSSDAKFDSSTGWPSFYQPLAGDKVVIVADNSGGMRRHEVRCARCDSHLGHVFNDGPPPTHLRYCLNSVSLKFVKTTKDHWELSNVFLFSCYQPKRWLP